MNLHRNPMASAIALILACSLLAACGGGSGGGLARSSPPPAPQPSAPPPPPATPLGPCPMPVTGNCVVTTYGTMLGGRDSANALSVQLPVGQELRLGSSDPTVGSQALREATYSFAGGTLVEHGGLVIGYGNTLRSNLQVQRDGYLGIGGSAVGSLGNDGITEVFGTLTGAVANRGKLYLLGTIHGDVHNEGLFDADAAAWNGVLASITGNYADSPSSTLAVALCSKGWDCQSGLTVSGRADIAGTLQLRQYTDAWGPYELPGTGAHRILHANGGVFGTFARWTSPGLFIEGSLRYGAYDVWFDLTRISLQAAMAGQGFGGITLASAANLDRALAIADGFTTAPNTSQARFLRSAGRLLWLDDAQQAARSLDSLAGSLHIDAVGALANNDALARGIGARTLALQPGDHAGAWSRLQGGDTIAGFDQWLSPRLLAGATVAQARDAHSDGFGGRSRHDSPQAALYLRWFGNDGWYAGGSAGYAQHALALDRRIDLAGGGRWNAYAHRRLGITSLDAEAGRRFDVGGANIAPYLWLGADVIRSEGAIEQGQTGLELTLQANAQASLDAGLGVRVGKRWRVGETGWLAFDADARYRQRLVQAGDPLRAAFIGVPDAWFDVPGHEARSGTWLDLGLRGGFGHGWAWSVGHAGSLVGGTRDRRWQFGLHRTF